MSNVSLRWVVALGSEANGIISKYKLKQVTDDNLYRIYKDKSELNWLIISGIGQVNAAAATMHLFHVSKAPKWACWINIGIAGSGIGELGEVFLIDKITQKSSGRSSYPAVIINDSIFRARLLTVDKPTTEYLGQDLIDMEAYAFVQVASKLSCRELILVLKIVSDGKNDDIKNLTKQKISQLIIDKLDIVENLIEKLKTLSSLEFERLALPHAYGEIIKRHHFSASQLHQLLPLVKRWTAVNPSEDLLESIKHLTNSRLIIDYLSRFCEMYEIEWV